MRHLRFLVLVRRNPSAILLLVQLAGPHEAVDLVRTIGWALLASGLLPLVVTRGRHLSWLVLFAAGGLCLAWVPG